MAPSKKKTDKQKEIDALKAEYKALTGRETKSNDLKRLKSKVEAERKVKGAGGAMDPEKAYDETYKFLDEATAIYENEKPGKPMCPQGAILIMATQGAGTRVHWSKHTPLELVDAAVDAAKRQVSMTMMGAVVQNALNQGQAQAGQPTPKGGDEPKGKPAEKDPKGNSSGKSKGGKK